MEKEEKPCAGHEWQSMGGVSKEIWYSVDGTTADYGKKGEAVVFAVFCRHCGAIKKEQF